MSESTPETSGSNVIQISATKNAGFYTNLSKKYLSSNPEIEMSGLGSAITIAVTAAEHLRHQGYATIKSIQSSSVVNPNPTNEGPKSSKIKIVIGLARSENFEQLYEKDQRELEEKKKEENTTSA